MQEPSYSGKQSTSSSKKHVETFTVFSMLLWRVKISSHRPISHGVPLYRNFARSTMHHALLSYQISKKFSIVSNKIQMVVLAGANGP